MTRISLLPIHRRPRERLLEKGASELTDEELLAVLIRTGIRGKSAIDLGKLILRKYPIAKLPRVTLKNLREFKGLGLAKSAPLLAAFEIARRAQETPTDLPLTNPERVLSLLISLKNQRKEHFVALYLNSRHHLIYQETVSIGHLNGSLVHPREVFKPALEHAAASVILAHNHPSGDPTPSQDDILLTERLIQAGQLLDIHILDHLIITKDSWSSLKQLGHI